MTNQVIAFVYSLYIEMLLHYSCFYKCTYFFVILTIFSCIIYNTENNFKDIYNDYSETMPIHFDSQKKIFCKLNRGICVTSAPSLC